MKKIIFSLIISVALVATSCGPTANNGNILGNIIGALGSETTINSLTDLVIGSVKIDQSQLCGEWSYSAPGCAFTSENLLAKAGGAVAAGQVKEKLLKSYNSIGINSTNTKFVFTEKGEFNGLIKGIPWNGTYSYDANSGALKLKSLLLSSTAYITRTKNGLSLTFESKKLLTLLQGASTLSGNSTIESIGDLSKNFDGVRIGFDMSKTSR